MDNHLRIQNEVKRPLSFPHDGDRGCLRNAELCRTDAPSCPRTFLFCIVAMEASGCSILSSLFRLFVHSLAVYFV
jgi:hypothetical protein